MAWSHLRGRYSPKRVARYRGWIRALHRRGACSWCREYNYPTTKRGNAKTRTRPKYRPHRVTAADLTPIS